jgi:hypothetical protein
MNSSNKLSEKLSGGKFLETPVKKVENTTENIGELWKI